MKRIYTRMGDYGLTAIHGGRRVSKTDTRIEANGSLDELNVAIGIVRTLMPPEHRWQPALRDVQLRLMSLMSIVATPDSDRGNNPNTLPDSIVESVERLIDEVAAECGEPEYFILPGGTQLSAFLHQARVTARRAERRLWSLNDADTVPGVILRYINRLSDLFFIMARCEALSSGMGEERWKQFSYKRMTR